VKLTPAIPLAELDERTFTTQVIGTNANPGLARLVGFDVYHTLRSKGSQPGFPDWTLARERVVFLELKTETGVVSAHQKRWLTALAKAQAEVYLVRPRHLDALSTVLGARAHPSAGLPLHAQEACDELLLELKRWIGVQEIA
jgi:hypothetical protein